MPRLDFEITIPPDPARQHVVITGTGPALGDWQPEKGVALQLFADGKFRGGCDLPHGLVEFKITRGTWETEETYADGTAVLNYQYLVAHDLTAVEEVENWSDCPPIEHEHLWGKAIECELHATQLGETRRVFVWLPPGYLRSADSRHPVLYLLDGQDALLALSSPENETLEADEWVVRLSRENLIPELILVAVCHSERFGRRDTELSPQIDGPKMADFLATDLKHFIDYTLCRDRVLSGPGHTGVLGFSLGASLALYCAVRHAHTFGRIACLSTDFEDLSLDPPEDCALIRLVEHERHFTPGHTRLYFDHGTIGTDRVVARHQQRLDAVLKAKGFREGHDCKTLIAEGAEHHLSAWRARLGAPLLFLFGK
ncbi:MAG: alpha/beta hydrolase-fold protein [Chthoniobacteraceae bacterium]